MNYRVKSFITNPIKTIAMVLVFMLAMTFTTLTQSPAKAATKGFRVSGTKLLDANGNEFLIRGINHAHNWYQSTDSTAIPAIARTGANTIRLVLSDGEQYSKDSLSTLKNLISMCEQNKLVAIVEVHDATGSNDVNSLVNAANYWIEMKSALQGHESTVILNIANEWCGEWNSDTWADGYKKVIPMIRNAGIKNTILVDCAGWGQYPKSVADRGRDVFNSDSERNTMFSLHLYEYGGGTADQVKSNISGVTNQGLAVIVGEFGYKHTNGDVDENTIVNYCKSNKIGYLPWSWYGNGGGVEFLDLVKDVNGSSYTEWGNIFFNNLRGLSDSKRCSVFNGSSSNGGNNGGSSNSGLVNGATYYLKNAQSGLYLDVENGRDQDGTNIRQWYGNRCDAQKFKLVSVGNGYYKLVSQTGSRNKVLDVCGRSSNNGANIELYSDNNGWNQQFKIQSVGNGKYVLYTRISNSSSVVEVTARSNDNGANVEQWQYNGGYHQQWYFERA
ncbi:MAG: cellulase family glycosylhydrolase [Clostridium sp.]